MASLASRKDQVENRKQELENQLETQNIQRTHSK